MCVQEGGKMERLTYFDYFSECYKIRPNAQQGQIIQRLGKYEDKAEKVIDTILGKVKDDIAAEKITDKEPNDWLVGYNEGLTIAEEYIDRVLAKGEK
jgi:hypothetical protein